MSLDRLLATDPAAFPSAHCATLEEIVLCRLELFALQYRAQCLLELEDDPQIRQQESAEILCAWQQLQRHVGNERYPSVCYNPHDSWTKRKQQLIGLEQQLGTKRALKLLRRCAERSNFKWLKTEKNDRQWLKQFPAPKRAYNPASKWTQRREQLQLLEAELGLQAALQVIEDLWLAGRVSAAVRARDCAWLVWWGGTPVLQDDALSWEIDS